MATIAEQLEKRKDWSLPARVITSPLLTVGLASILGGMGVAVGAPILGTTIAGGAAKTGLAAGAAIEGASLLSSSPTLLGAVTTRLLRPGELGGTIGTGIEEGKGFIENIIDTGKDVIEDIPGGAATAGALAGGAAVAGAPIIIKIFEEFKGTDNGDKVPEITDLPSSQVVAVPPFEGQPAALQPLAPVKQPVEEKPVAVGAPQKPVTIKNTFKPSVDISFKKSKKFINQQVLIKG